MTRLSTLQALKKLAAENFKIKDVEFVEFDTIQAKEFSKLFVSKIDGEKKDIEETHQLDVWVDMLMKYEGTPPQSYRTLNSMIMDWVDENEDKLKKEINPKLKEFLNKVYPDVDTSDLDEDFDDYIWEDQVDYMPELDESNKEIKFSIELVLDVDEIQPDEE
jgi:hypothetical protein